MKYLTPELLVRCRSLDADVSDAAAEEWEQAIDAYRERLRVIRKGLPRGARGLLSQVTLHDAKILALVYAKEDPWLTLLIHLEGTPSQPGEKLQLAYHLVVGEQGGVRVANHPGLHNGNSNLRWILYDEFDFDEQRSFFTHSLLLADGKEFEIRFHDLRVRRLGDVLLPPLELMEGKKTWPSVSA